MRIVITGGTGYLGARLCRDLGSAGHEVIPVFRKLSASYASWKALMFDTIEGDIRNQEIIQQIADAGADVVIHLVSLDHRASEADPATVSETNVLPTWQLLDTCTKAGLKKFIFFSTIQVYGKLPIKILDEQTTIQTGNTYGLTHHLSEQLCDHYNRNTATNIITVRLSNSYGEPVFDENNCWWLAINDLCRMAIEKKELRLLSDGTPQRDFIHGNDVVKGVETLLHATEKRSDNVYHISSGQTSTIMELALKIRQVYQNRYQEEIPVYTPAGLFNPATFNPHSEKYTISNQKLTALGFEPSISLEAGINRIFDYLKRD
ncbi:MAG: NAD(P)-dependent oxidoreductase [Bacteroidia bacterium]|jgi:UDP-glucose 4-epimerase